ncbi:MAG: hypothetical protein IKR13_03955 [Victivallales bacterium]|nr:hypothetical protein [Victivallales bacterium]
MTRRLRNWDYTQRTIYMITCTLADRSREWLGHLRSSVPGHSCLGKRAWYIEPTLDGEAVLEALSEMPRHYPQVQILEVQLMPEHLHFMPFVREKLPKPLGLLIRGFKAGATKRWKDLRKNAQAQDNCSVPAHSCAGSPVPGHFCPGMDIPRWSEGFTDTILQHEGQLPNMFNYLHDNPRRAAEKRLHPELFKVVRDLALPLDGGRLVGHFSAIGNHSLLCRPMALIQCSRSYFRYVRIAKPTGGLKIASDASGEPMVEFSTQDYQALRDYLLAQAQHGIVLISPCISDGERQIARETLAAGLPLVTMHNKGFSNLHKPTGRYFDACAAGRLLMLAPAAWPYQPGEKAMTRNDATAMNRLCQWLVGTKGNAINYHGMCPESIDELACRTAKIIESD